MESDLDMNGNRILNLPQPTSASEPARLQDLLDQVLTPVMVEEVEVIAQAAAEAVVDDKADRNGSNITDASAWRVAIGSDKATNVTAAIGSTEKTVQEYLTSLAVSRVESFGGIPGLDGGGAWIDNAAAIQAAHDALPAVGGTIRMGPGAWGVSNVIFTKPVTLEVDGGRIGGLWGGFSRVVGLGTTGDVFTVSAGFRVSGVCFDHALTRTAGHTIYAEDPFISITHCNFTKHYRAIGANGTSISNICWNNFRNATKSSDAAGGGHIDVGRSRLTVALNIVGNTADSDDAAVPPATGDMCSFGIRLGYTDANIVSHNDIIRSGKNLVLDPQTGHVCANNYFALNFFDTAQYGIYCTPVAGSSVVRNRFLLNWASGHTATGTLLFADNTMGIILGTHFVFHQGNINGADGLTLDGPNVKETYIDGSLFAGNTAGSAISVGAGVSNFHITNCRIGPSDDFGANLYPLYLGGSNTDYTVRDNDLAGNTNPAFLGVVPSTADVRGNRGFKTKNSGTATVTSASTSVTVDHGLSVTPIAADISVVPTSAWGSTTKFWVSAVTPTSFTVTVDVAPATDFTLSWNIRSENL